MMEYQYENVNQSVRLACTNTNVDQAEERPGSPFEHRRHRVRLSANGNTCRENNTSELNTIKCINNSSTAMPHILPCNWSEDYESKTNHNHSVFDQVAKDHSDTAENRYEKDDNNNTCSKEKSSNNSSAVAAVIQNVDMDELYNNSFDVMQLGTNVPTSGHETLLHPCVNFSDDEISFTLETPADDEVEEEDKHILTKATMYNEEILVNEHRNNNTTIMNESNECSANADELRSSPMPFTLLNAAHDLRRKRIKKVSHYILGPLLGEGMGGVVRDGIDIAGENGGFHRCAVKIVTIPRRWVASPTGNSTEPLCNVPERGRRGLMSLEEKRYAIFRNELNNLQRFHNKHIQRSKDVFTRYGKEYVVIPFAVCSLEHLVKEAMANPVELKTHKVPSSSKALQNKKLDKNKNPNPVSLIERKEDGESRTSTSRVEMEQLNTLQKLSSCCPSSSPLTSSEHVMHEKEYQTEEELEELPEVIDQKESTATSSSKSAHKRISSAKQCEEKEIYCRKSSSSSSSSSSTSSSPLVPEQSRQQKQEQQLHKRHHRTTHTTSELSDFKFIHRAEEREEKRRLELQLQEQHKTKTKDSSSPTKKKKYSSNGVSTDNNLIGNDNDTDVISLRNSQKGKDKSVAVRATSSDDSDLSSVNSSSSSTRTIDSYCRSSAIVSSNTQNCGSNKHEKEVNIKKERQYNNSKEYYPSRPQKVKQAHNAMQNSLGEQEMDRNQLSSSSSLHLEVISSPVTASTSLISCSDTQSVEFASLTKSSTHDNNTKNGLLSIDYCDNKNIETQCNFTSITANTNVVVGKNNKSKIINNYKKSEMVNRIYNESSRSTQLLIPEKTRYLGHNGHVHSSDLRGSLFRSHSMCTTPLSSMEETSMLDSISLNSLPQVNYHRPYPHTHTHAHINSHQENTKSANTVTQEQLHDNKQLERSLSRKRKQSSRRRAILSPALIKSIMYQLLCGVAYLHRQCLAHNDIKPSNVLIFEDGTVALSDLGSVGKRYNDEGTPLYAAPELCRYFYGAYDDEVSCHSYQEYETRADGSSHCSINISNVNKTKKGNGDITNEQQELQQVTLTNQGNTLSTSNLQRQTEINNNNKENNNNNNISRVKNNLQDKRNTLEHESIPYTSEMETQRQQQQQYQQHQKSKDEISMNIDARKCDMWCCGLVLYYLITGQVGPLNVQRQCLHTETSQTINNYEDDKITVKGKYTIQKEQNDSRSNSIFDQRLPPHSRFQLYRAIAHDALCFTLDDIPPLPCGTLHQCPSAKLFHSQKCENCTPNNLLHVNEWNNENNDSNSASQQESASHTTVTTNQQKNVNICTTSGIVCEQHKYNSNEKNYVNGKNNEVREWASEQNEYPVHTVQHLLSCLLEADPNKRITAEDALQHPWLAIYLKARKQRKIHARALRSNENNSTHSSNPAKQNNRGVLFFSSSINDNNDGKDNDEDKIYCTHDVQVNETNLRSPTSPLVQHGRTNKSTSEFLPNENKNQLNGAQHKEELLMEQRLEESEELTDNSNTRQNYLNDNNVQMANTTNTPSYEQLEQEQHLQHTQSTVDTFCIDSIVHKNVNTNINSSNNNTVKRESEINTRESNEKDVSKAMAFSEVVKVQAAIDEAISRDVAQRVLHAPLFKRILRNDRLNHLQFVADCCNTLHIPLPPEIIQAPSAEPYGPEEYYPPYQQPARESSQEKQKLHQINFTSYWGKEQNQEGKRNKTQHKEKVEHPSWYGSDVHNAYGYSVCTATYTLPSVMPAGCVDPELFLPYEEANYYESKGGKAEFDVCRLQVQPMKVMQLEEYLHNVVMVQCGYRTCADPMFTVAAAAIFAATANNNNSYFGLSQRVKRKALTEGDNSTNATTATVVEVVSNNNKNSSVRSSSHARECSFNSTPVEGVVVKPNSPRWKVLPIESQSNMQITSDRNDRHHPSETEEVNKKDRKTAETAVCNNMLQKQSEDDWASKNSESSDHSNASRKNINEKQSEKKSSYTTFMQRFKSSKKKTDTAQLNDDETKSVQSNSSSKNSTIKNRISTVVNANDAESCALTPTNNMYYKQNLSSSSMSTNAIASEHSSEKHDMGFNQLQQNKRVVPLSALAQNNCRFDNSNNNYYKSDSSGSQICKLGNVEEKRQERASRKSVFHLNGNETVSVASNENSVGSRSVESSIRTSQQQRRHFRSDYSACSTDDTITVDSRDDHVVMRESSKCLCGLM